MYVWMYINSNCPVPIQLTTVAILPSFSQPSLMYVWMYINSNCPVPNQLTTVAILPSFSQPSLMYVWMYINSNCPVPNQLTTVAILPSFCRSLCDPHHIMGNTSKILCLWLRQVHIGIDHVPVLSMPCQSWKGPVPKMVQYMYARWKALWYSVCQETGDLGSLPVIHDLTMLYQNSSG